MKLDEGPFGASVEASELPDLPTYILVTPNCTFPMHTTLSVWCQADVIDEVGVCQCRVA